MVINGSHSTFVEMLAASWVPFQLFQRTKKSQPVSAGWLDGYVVHENHVSGVECSRVPLNCNAPCLARRWPHPHAGIGRFQSVCKNDHFL